MSSTYVHTPPRLPCRPTTQFCPDTQLRILMSRISRTTPWPPTPRACPRPRPDMHPSWIFPGLVPLNPAGAVSQPTMSRLQPHKQRSSPRQDWSSLGPQGPSPTENTPLLAPLVPCIAEEVDGHDGSQPDSTTNMYREELAILTKYTLPVFGTHVLEYLSSLHQSSQSAIFRPQHSPLRP
ncbi:hypothetical protein B0H21DRAFT_174607 [Amylocystis lapponica]|nr:hypothetical protein B0H21DRAFT_174607 [Amylocystis lapponica]